MNKRHIWKWWAGKQLKYNGGLVLAGISAFFLYAILGSILLMPYQEFEITLFTMLFQGTGYLMMMVIANICYYVGPVIDILFNKANDEAYRLRLFKLGYWFSFGLPFLIPLMIVVIYFIKYF